MPSAGKSVGIVDPYYYAARRGPAGHEKAKHQNASRPEGQAGLRASRAPSTTTRSSPSTRTDLVAFKGVPETEQALLDGRCVGFVYDDVL